ncbi:TonB-dependent receptor family protein [Aequorivita antarctica]|uniref:TonB-dependent receptor n=1 Tax=Aequorivita antarctica TaxID=153266 RepID=A0A5C6Z2F7_9FLAO|nr:TonB-dependent receptor [Aequorivita antarctica]TXD73699.1 TonB-dependent receptor [Aequorivita antarctica]SRX75874.1 Vitamin B12 transporter BtuB [Aequorivita antarctica]
MKFPLQNTMAVIFLTAFFNFSFGQNIKGSVLTEENLPIENVFVFFKNQIIAKTDKNGLFAIPEKFKLPLSLRFEHPDYFIKNAEVTENNMVFNLSLLSKTENLQEIIISSGYQKKSSTNPAAELIIPTEKITSEKFEEYSPIDLVSTINETPGVFIQSGAINTNRIVIRGVGSRTLYGTNKIRAYFNGIPITNGVGETAIDVFDPEDIQSLEIIKGPKTTGYGSNLGGTLLLNSKQAAVGESFLRSNLTVGSFGMIKNSVSVGISTEKFSLNLNYDHLETKGFRENSDYDRKTVLLTSKYILNSKNELSILVNYIDYFAQIPSSIGKTAFEENPSQAAFTWAQAQGFEDNKQILTGLSFTHHFSKNFSNASSVFYTYLDHYEPRPFNILDEFINGYGARTVFAKDFIFLKNKANFSFGGEFYKDEYHWKTIENLYEVNNGNGSLEGNQLSDNLEIRDNLNVFAMATLPFTQKLKVQIGLNFNLTHYNFKDQFNFDEIDKSATRNFDPILAPNFNLLYQFTPDIGAYFNFSKGFNYPSIEETLTPEGLINPELGPEKGFNYELGSELFLFERKFHLQVVAYLLYIDDLLVAERVGDDQYIGRNAGKTEHKGIEINTEYTIPVNENFYVSLFMNAEFNNHKFVDFVDGEDNFSGNQLTGVPNKKINAGINFFSNYGFSLNTNYLYISEIPLNDSNLLFSDPYNIFNLKASYKKAVSKNIKLEINGGVNNLTDEKYASSVLINATGFGNTEPRFYYPGIPRNWYGGFKVSYRL